jgi:hypothetical protein
MSETSYLRCDACAEESDVALRNVYPEWLVKLGPLQEPIAQLVGRGVDWGRDRPQIDCFEIDCEFVYRHRACVLRLRSEYERP